MVVVAVAVARAESGELRLWYCQNPRCYSHQRAGRARVLLAARLGPDSRVEMRCPECGMTSVFDVDGQGEADSRLRLDYKGRR